jgi:hypothetical protein
LPSIKAQQHLKANKKLAEAKSDEEKAKAQKNLEDLMMKKALVDKKLNEQ